jgi:hypothetical protein
VTAWLVVIVGSLLSAAAVAFAIWWDERERKRREAERRAFLFAAFKAVSMQIGLAMLPAFQKAVVAFEDCAKSMEKLKTVLVQEGGVQ